jgi:hypothetical protein
METDFWYIAILLLFVVGVPLGIWLSIRSDYKFRRQLAARTSVEDTEFISSFYADSNITPDIPLRLRPIYGQYFEIDPLRIHPEDLPPGIYEFDTGPLVHAIQNEFGIKISDDDQERTTGEFDSMVRLIARLCATNGNNLNTSRST